MQLVKSFGSVVPLLIFALILIFALKFSKSEKSNPLNAVFAQAEASAKTK